MVDYQSTYEQMTCDIERKDASAWEKVVVWWNTEERTYGDGKIIVRGQKEFVALVDRHMSMILATDAGQKLVRSIATNKGRHTVTICEKEHSGTTKPLRKKDAKRRDYLGDCTTTKSEEEDCPPNVGSDVQVGYPQHKTRDLASGQHEGLEDCKDVPWATFPPDVVLFHELVHASYFVNGTGDDKFLGKPYVNANEFMAIGGRDMREQVFNQEFSENHYRFQRKYPLPERTASMCLPGDSSQTPTIEFLSPEVPGAD